MIYAVFLCNDHHRFAIPSTIFGSVSWRQTWPNHDNLRRLTVDSKSSRRGCWCVAIHMRSFYVPRVIAKHPPVALVFKPDHYCFQQAVAAIALNWITIEYQTVLTKWCWSDLLLNCYNAQCVLLLYYVCNMTACIYSSIHSTMCTIIYIYITVIGALESDLVGRQRTNAHATHLPDFQ